MKTLVLLATTALVVFASPAFSQSAAAGRKQDRLAGARPLLLERAPDDGDPFGDRSVDAAVALVHALMARIPDGAGGRLRTRTDRRAAPGRSPRS